MAYYDTISLYYVIKIKIFSHEFTRSTTMR